MTGTFDWEMFGGFAFDGTCASERMEMELGGGVAAVGHDYEMKLHGASPIQAADTTMYGHAYLYALMFPSPHTVC